MGEMTVRELRGMVKAVLESPATPKKLKDKLQLIMGFLDKVIKAKELG